jgi:hypothetical protein
MDLVGPFTKSRAAASSHDECGAYGICDAQGLDWDIVNKTVLYAIKNSYHTPISNTLFKVFMGRQAREPTDLIFGM